MTNQHICIVGAGLCGTLLAVRMAQRGFRVTLCEKRSDLRKVTQDAGRSINLAISDRGFKALRLVGLEDRVRAEVIPMYGRYIHPVNGSAWLSRYSGRESEFINSVSRPGLNKILLDEAEKYPNIEVLFEHPCASVDLENCKVHLTSPSGQHVTIEPDIIVGTDGAGSEVRAAFVEKSASLRFSYSVDFLSHGYKELEIPAGSAGSWRIEKNALHIWPRQQFMLIALPNLDGSFTVTLFLGFDGDPGFNSLDTDQKIRDFFDTTFPSAARHMPDLVEDFHQNPASSLGTVRCYPWQYNGKALLMGDAAHAVVPFYGQGMNCAMEDVVVLDGLLDEFGNDWPVVLQKYQSVRKKDADAIADLALENYYEMRDHVDNPAFILKRKLEMQLEREHPEYSSKYNLVTFNEDTPYSEARRKGRIQDNLLLSLCEGISDIEEIDRAKLLEQLQRATES